MNSGLWEHQLVYIRGVKPVQPIQTTCKGFITTGLTLPKKKPQNIKNTYITLHRHHCVNTSMFNFTPLHHHQSSKFPHRLPKRRHQRLSYVFDSATGFDAVVKAHPLLVVGILSGAHDVLVALVVGVLVEDPGAALHTDGVAAGEVGAQVSTVTVALIATALEILLLKECDLERGER